MIQRLDSEIHVYGDVLVIDGSQRLKAYRTAYVKPWFLKKDGSKTDWTPVTYADICANYSSRRPHGHLPNGPTYKAEFRLAALPHIDPPSHNKGVKKLSRAKRKEMNRKYR